MKSALLPVLLLLAACGDSGSDVSAEFAAAAECSAQGLENLDEVFGEVTELLAAIGGTLPPNATYTPPDYSITMSLGTVAGSITSPDTISDGIDPGESASASWNLNPLAGAAVGGNGTFTLDRITQFVFAISGAGSIIDGLCIFNVSNVDLSLDLDSSLGPVGSFDFSGATPSGPIDGTMTFDGSDIADVEATYLGVGVTFRINLNTFSPIY